MQTSTGTCNACATAPARQPSATRPPGASRAIARFLVDALPGAPTPAAALPEGLRPALTAFARRHRIAGLVWQAFDAANSWAAAGGPSTTGTPPASLARRARADGVRAHRLAERLSALTQLLAAAGIPSLSIRGPALSAALYGTPAMRAFDDLDILVPERALPRVAELLGGKDFTPVDAEDARRPARPGKLGAGVCLWAPDRSYSVDLNPPLEPRYWRRRWTFDALWDSRREFTVDGCRFVTPGAADTVCLLALHGLKHGWQRLAWVLDFVVAAGKLTASDWDAALSCATIRGQRRALLLGCALAMDIAPRLVRCPSVACALAVDSGVRAVAKRVWTALDSAPDAAPHVSRRVLLGMADSPAARAAMGLRIGFTPSAGDVRSVRLPAWLGWGYWIVRPVRLLARGVRHLARAPWARGAPRPAAR